MKLKDKALLADNWNEIMGGYWHSPIASLSEYVFLAYLSLLFGLGYVSDFQHRLGLFQRITLHL